MTLARTLLFSGAPSSIVKFIASAYAQTTNYNSQFITVSKPAGTIEGDLMIAYVIGGYHSTTFYGPSGWTKGREVISSLPSLSCAFFYKTVSASEPSNYAFQGLYDLQSATILTYRDAAIDVIGQFTVATSVQPYAPSITVNTSGSVLVAALFNNGTTAPGVPTGMTSRVVDSDGTVPSYRVSDQKVPTGATGNRTGSGTVNAGLLVSLKGQKYLGPPVTVTGTTNTTWYPNAGPLSLSTSGTYNLVSSTSNISVDLKIWGAGGGDPGNNSGGGGGYASGRLMLTTGTTFHVIVGAPGTGPGGEGFGGGGYSAIFLSTNVTQGNTLLMAGGGGGGMNDNAGGTGGAGGGNSGQNGTGWNSTSYGGYGGTLGAGGAPWSTASGTAGSALQGGNSGNAGNPGGSPGGGGAGSSGGWGGGGGGGGYFGGGGGQSDVGFSKGNGGGGSGRINGLYIDSGLLQTGDRNTPANSSDAARGSSGGPRQPGRVVLTKAP